MNNKLELNSMNISSSKLDRDHIEKMYKPFKTSNNFGAHKKGVDKTEETLCARAQNCPGFFSQKRHHILFHGRVYDLSTSSSNSKCMYDINVYIM